VFFGGCTINPLLQEVALCPVVNEPARGGEVSIGKGHLPEVIKIMCQKTGERPAKRFLGK
jgi:hypothetical protein